MVIGESEPLAHTFSILDRDMKRRWPSLLTGAFALSALSISIDLSAGFVDLPPTTRARSFVEGTQKVVCFTAAMKDEAPENLLMDQRESGRIKGSKKTAGSVDDPTTEIPKATKKGKKAVSKKRKKDVAPKHWLLDTDDFIFHGKSSTETISDSSNVLLRFTVRGNPLPLRRHRTSRGFVYNPSAPAQASFRKIVQSVVFPDHDYIIDSDGDGLEPIFSEGYTLAMTIVFRTKRPMNHFIGSKPAAGRLKESAPAQTAPTRCDVDNLAKFVLDSLNGLLYHDDRQISSLHVTKLLDNHEDCRGSTEVCLRVLADDKVSTLLNNTFQLF
jgi:hypothetical protein